jgi:hypothetical protein
MAVTLSADQDLGEDYYNLIAPEPLDVHDEGTWAHLVLVFDAESKSLTLYVNGDQAGTRAQSSMWHAGGPLVVGGAWYSPDNMPASLTDRWIGGIDDVTAYQSAMSAAQVRILNAQQSAPGVE